MSYTYEVELPGGYRFDVESPEALSDEQAYQAVLEQLQEAKLPVQQGEPAPRQPTDLFGAAAEVVAPISEGLLNTAASGVEDILSVFPPTPQEGVLANLWAGVRPLWGALKLGSLPFQAIGDMVASPIRAAIGPGLASTLASAAAGALAGVGVTTPRTLPPRMDRVRVVLPPQPPLKALPAMGESSAPRTFMGGPPTAEPSLLPVAYQRVFTSAVPEATLPGTRYAPALERAVGFPQPLRVVGGELRAPRPTLVKKEPVPIDQVPPKGPLAAPATATTEEEVGTRSALFSKEGIKPDESLVGQYINRLIRYYHEQWEPRWLRNLTSREEVVRRQFPAAPYVSELARFNTAPVRGLYEFSQSKEFTKLVSRPASEWIEAERIGYEVYKKTKSEADAMAAIQQYSPDIADLLQRLKTYWLPIIQESRQTLGVSPIPDRNILPVYMPRVSLRDLEDIERLTRSPFISRLPTTIGTFQHPRLTKGPLATIGPELYHDPRVAYLFYEKAAHTIAATANLVRRLRDGGWLFTSEKAAQAAGHVRPVEITGLLPIQTGSLWVPNKDVAKLLNHNFRVPGEGFWSFWNVTGQLFRNLNLINPIPHFKNMFWLYRLSGGKLYRLPGLAMEYVQRSNPTRIAQFEELLPSSGTARTGWELSELLQHQITGEKSWAYRWNRLIESPEYWSRKILWEGADPAIRYARWVQYVEQGMNPQQAAGQVFRDLVNYGERSHLRDFLRSLPVNYFVPWRLGSIRSVLGAVRDHPGRTAILVGLVDYVREAIYRQTGWWLHLPGLDNLEGSIYQLLLSADAATRGHVGAALTQAGNSLLSLAAPGFSRKLQDAVNPGEWLNTERVFWGVAEVLNLLRVAHDLPSTGPAGVLALLGIAFGARPLAVEERGEITGYAPRRPFTQWLPESLPGMTAGREAKALDERQIKMWEQKLRRDNPTLATVLGGP